MRMMGRKRERSLLTAVVCVLLYIRVCVSMHTCAYVVSVSGYVCGLVKLNVCVVSMCARVQMSICVYKWGKRVKKCAY